MLRKTGTRSLSRTPWGTRTAGCRSIASKTAALLQRYTASRCVPKALLVSPCGKVLNFEKRVKFNTDPHGVEYPHALTVNGGDIEGFSACKSSTSDAFAVIYNAVEASSEDAGYEWTNCTAVYVYVSNVPCTSSLHAPIMPIVELLFLIRSDVCSIKPIL